MRVCVQLITAFCLLLFTGLAATPAAAAIPNPVLYMTSSEPFTVNGQNFIRVNLAVFNLDSYPAELFVAAPALPPCGANANSARSWVDVFDSRGKRLYGFCALGSPASLDKLWFAYPADELPPSYVYIEITDRQTGTKYRSNLSETTL
jgi:hypothetical protein